MKNILGLKGTVGLLAILLLGGCATGPQMSISEKNMAYEDYIKSNELVSLKKIRSFRYQGWQSLTNDYLIISTSQRNKYLIKIKGYCPDLSFSQAILINQSMSSILTTNFDSISMLRTPQLKCYIKTIHQVSKEQLKEIMAIGKSQKSADESA